MPPFAEVFLPFIFLNLKITNMKHLTLRLLFYLALPLLWGCSNDDNSLAGPSANGSLIEFNPTENYKGSYEVSIQESGALLFIKVDGVQQSDEFIVRKAENNEDLYLDWGYKYAGIIGDELGYYQRTYRSDTIMVGLGFKDNWSVGEYDLLLVRGDTYQKLDRFKFCILKDITVDLTQKEGGVIGVVADGWLDISTYGSVDSLEFVNKSTGEIIESISSTYQADEAKEYLPVKFSYEKYPTGEYEMWIKRWDYGFRQKICEFDLFQYAFVNSDPIVKAEDGNYYIQFYVSDFDETRDTYAIVDTPDQSYYYDDGNLSKANWDPETLIYRLKLDDANWFGRKKDGISFTMQLTIKGLDITVTGHNKLQLSE